MAASAPEIPISVLMAGQALRVLLSRNAALFPEGLYPEVLFLFIDSVGVSGTGTVARFAPSGFEATGRRGGEHPPVCPAHIGLLYLLVAGKAFLLAYIAALGPKDLWQENESNHKKKNTVHQPP